MATIRIYFESMAGTHLLDAIDALRDSGSADALYGDPYRSRPREGRTWEDVTLAKNEAEGRQMAYSRRALLFAAFAAEAYINDYLYEHVADEADRRPLVMMSAVEKYIVLPKLLAGRALFARDETPWSTLRWLFRRRDELVHAKPHDGLQLVGEDPQTHNPKNAAWAIVAVADSARRLESSELETVAATVHREREAILTYGKDAELSLPAIDDSPAPFDLYGYLRNSPGDAGGAED